MKLDGKFTSDVESDVLKEEPGAEYLNFQMLMQNQLKGQLKKVLRE